MSNRGEDLLGKSKEDMKNFSEQNPRNLDLSNKGDTTLSTISSNNDESFRGSMGNAPRDSDATTRTEWSKKSGQAQPTRLIASNEFSKLTERLKDTSPKNDLEFLGPLVSETYESLSKKSEAHASDRGNLAHEFPELATGTHDFDDFGARDSFSKLEKSNMQQEEFRRQTIMGSRFGEAFKGLKMEEVHDGPQAEVIDAIKLKNRIDIGAITKQMKNRFMGQSDAVPDYSNMDPMEYEKSIKFMKEAEAHESKQTILDFIEKFGFVELKEIDNILIGPQKEVFPKGGNQPFDIPGRKKEDDSINDISVRKDLDQSANLDESVWGITIGPDPEQSSRQSIIPSSPHPLEKRYFMENVEDTPLLETAMVSEINKLLEGSHSSVICAYAVSPKSKLMAIFGSETGEVIECMAGDKPGVKKHTLKNKITAIGISPNDEYMAYGSANSELAIKKTEGKGSTKLIKNLNDQKISHIIFTENNICLVGTVYNVYAFVIATFAFTTDVTMTSIYPRGPLAVMQILTTPHEGVWKTVIALNDRLCLYAIGKENKGTVPFSKVGADIEDEIISAQTLANKWPPCVDWVYPTSEESPLRLIVFWKQKLRIYQFLKGSYDESRETKLMSKIVWGTVLDNRMICIVNVGLEFEFLSIGRVFHDGFVDNQNHLKVPIYPGLLKDERDKGYMLKYKDKLEDETVEIGMKLPFFQFFRNRMKDTKEEMYMITDKGLMRYHLTSLDKIVESYIEKGKDELALGLMTSIFNEQMSAKKSEFEAVKLLAPRIMKLFVEKRYKNDMLVTDQKALMAKAFDILLSINNIESLFNDLRSMFIQKYFWEEISEFIKQAKIKFIPYDSLSEGIQYLNNEVIVMLLKEFKFDENRDDDTVINKILMIIKKKNIWPFMYKFCLFYPNQSIPLFLSMMAAEIVTMNPKTKESILKESIWTNIGNINLDKYFEEDSRRLFFRIFWFFNLVFSSGTLEISLHHFSSNVKRLKTNIPEIYSKTLEWILDKSNASIILAICPQIFFELVYQAILNQNMMSTPKVIELVKKIRNYYSKKTDETNFDTKTVARIRATQYLNNDTYAFGVAECTTYIFEDLIEAAYKQDLAFACIKLLKYGNYERKFESQEWIGYVAASAISEEFQEGKLWLNYRPVKRDLFEDLVIDVCQMLNKVKSNNKLRKDISDMALEKK